MNLAHMSELLILENVLVPSSMIANTHGFGGTRVADCVHGDLVMRDGRAVALQPSAGTAEAAHLITPRLPECHVHLDKCHTISRMKEGGRS